MTRAHELWGTQPWLQPAFSRLLGSMEARRAAEMPPERRLKARLPAPERAAKAVRPLPDGRGSVRAAANFQAVMTFDHPCLLPAFNGLFRNTEARRTAEMAPRMHGPIPCGRGSVRAAADFEVRS
jgi:hypothetical protein